MGRSRRRSTESLNFGGWEKMSGKVLTPRSTSTQSAIRGRTEPCKIEGMTINISLTPEAETKLRQRASSLGQDVSIVASDLLEEAVCRPTVEELLAPARRQIAESGMCDQALDGFFRDVLKEVRNEKKAKPT